jgi:hypothetical protein
MNRNIFRLFAIIAIAGLVFTGCQKEENLLDTENPIGQEKIVDAQQNFPILKGATIVKYDTVYIVDGSGELKPHRTMKIRNLNWSIVQEWLFVDMNTYNSTNSVDLFSNTSFYPGDTYGLTHGCYYPWDQIEDEVDGDNWEYIVWADEYWTEISGNQFHLPKIDTYGGANDGDITKLAMMLGSTSLVRQKLALAYDGVDNSYPEFVNTHAYMWIEARGTYAEVNKVTGCGVLAKWDGADSDHFWHVFTNITNLKANVRLVRDITSAQW